MAITYTANLGLAKPDYGTDPWATYVNNNWNALDTAFAANMFATLASYGAAGDGSTDDSTAIQAAIDSSAQVIHGNNLTYKCNSRLELSSNIVLRDMTLDFSGITELTSGLYVMLYAQGTGVVDSSALTANVAEGAYSVTVVDGTKFAAGDYVMLTAEDTYNYAAATVKRGEIKQVQSIATNTVTFREAVYEAYTTANTATLRKLSLLENITLDNVKIIGTNTENHKDVGLRAQYVRNLRVRNCEFKDIDTYECALFDTIDFDISNNFFNGVRYTGVGTVFYGLVLFNCCQWGTVVGNRGEELRHLVTTSSSQSYYGQPYHVVVNANIMKNAMAGDAYASWAYENHGFGRWITWSNNIADSCYAGINIEKGDQIVIGNSFRNCRSGCIYFDTDGRELKNILIKGNHLSKSSADAASSDIYGIVMQAHASQVRENILIDGNIIEGFGESSKQDFGIRIRPGNGAAKGCVISNNIITNPGAYESTDYGMYIEQAGWIIRSNTLCDYERAIQLVTGADNCTVAGNHFSVTTVASTQNTVSLASDNNVVKDNVFRGVYKSINGSGINNFVRDNVELGCSTVPLSITSTAAATYAVADTDAYVICNRAGTTTLTMPDATACPGRQVTVKTIQAQTVVSGASNVVPIDSGTAGTAILAAVDGAWALLRSDGTNWIIMQKG